MADLDILVTRSSMPALDEYVSEIAPLWESHWLTNQGTKHRQLEKELHSYLGVDNVSLFVNGHSALECVLETFELGNDGRDEVITTPFTFASTTHAIVRKGLKPVFCDIRPTDYTIDPDKIEDLVTEKTCAIVPVHVYGNVCNDEKIEAVAKRHNLKVIYDAAHAFGVEKDGVPVGRYGDASMFSFHATKVYNTIEGGAICYSDPALTERLAQWRNFGITGPETVEFVGGNLGMVVAGWATDHIFGSRAHRTCVFCMLGAILSTVAFWYIPDTASAWVLAIPFTLIAFFIYGPQALLGIAAANQATKEAAASANGILGIFGYASTLISGVGFGFVADHYGWGMTYIVILVFAVIGMLTIASIWNAKADGYEAAAEFDSRLTK